MIILASNQVEVSKVVLLPNSKGLFAMEMELLWDYLNRNDKEFMMDWSKYVQQVHI